MANTMSDAGSHTSACPNCGEPGDPGHHWMDDPVFRGYVCIGKDDPTISLDDLKRKHEL